MPIGTVTRVFETRGFGYITPDEGDRDVFVQVNTATSVNDADVAQLKSGARSPNERPRDDASPTGGSRLREGPSPSDGRYLREGMRVRFKIEDSDTGLHAVAVAPLH